MNPIDVLWDLQNLDLQLDEARRQLQEAQSRQRETPELLQAREQVQQTRETLHQTERRVRELELELKGLGGKIDELGGRLYGGRVTSPKELASLKHDQDFLQGNRSALEDQALGVMNEVEEQGAALQAQQETLARLEANWSREQTDLAGRVAELQGKIAQLSAQRVALLSDLDPVTLQTYEDLRRRKGGRAVSLLQGDLCLGCRESLPTAKRQLVRRRTELIFCGGCGRILRSE